MCVCVCVCACCTKYDSSYRNKWSREKIRVKPFNVISKPKMSRLLRHRGTKIEDMKHYETRRRMRRNAGTQETERNRKKTQENNNSNWNTRTQCITRVLLYLVNICRTADCVPPLKPGSPAAPPPGLHKSLFLKPHFNKIPPQKTRAVSLGERNLSGCQHQLLWSSLFFFFLLLPCIKK